MNILKKSILIGCLLLFGVFICVEYPGQDASIDFRDAPEDDSAAIRSTGTIAAIQKDTGVVLLGKEQSGLKVRDRKPAGKKINVKRAPVKWITIHGGSFMMGADGYEGLAEPVEGKHVCTGYAAPKHKVDVTTFQMAKTKVTVSQYAECVSAGKCTVPGRGWNCNWGNHHHRSEHPINCVDWNQATQYAKFKGARLPTEAEWEYAATSEGSDRLFPWGDEPVSCERAVVESDSGHGCGKGTTMPVCSKPKGNTAQGLCDMFGNLREYVQDKFAQYDKTPVDGSAYESDDTPYRGLRGLSFIEFNGSLRHCRSGMDPNYLPKQPSTINGFRIARDMPVQSD